MATRKKDQQKTWQGRPNRIKHFAAVLLTLVIMAGIGFVNASLLRIRRAEVVIPDLPRNFDGKTLLYVSDIDLCGLNTPARAGAVFEQATIAAAGHTCSWRRLQFHFPAGQTEPARKTQHDESKLIEAFGFLLLYRRFQAPLGKVCYCFHGGHTIVKPSA